MDSNLIITIEQLSNIDLFEKELNPVLTDYEKIVSKGFDGGDTVMYLLSVGGGVIVTQIANILANLIKRNDSKKVKINDIEVSGFSSKETIRIINELLTKNDSKKE